MKLKKFKILVSNTHTFINNSGYSMENDADINWPDNPGTNALYWVSSNGRREIVEALISHKSDVDVLG